jgi:hypothetical protein
MLCDPHDWQPGGGMGRYRCSVCFALGYRGIINQAQKTGGERSYEPGSRGSKRMSSIIEYRCKSKDCKLPAVNRKPQKCATHTKRKK